MYFITTVFAKCPFALIERARRIFQISGIKTYTTTKITELIYTWAKTRCTTVYLAVLLKQKGQAHLQRMHGKQQENPL